VPHGECNSMGEIIYPSLLTVRIAHLLKIMVMSVMYCTAQTTNEDSPPPTNCQVIENDFGICDQDISPTEDKFT